jgi:aldehyde dehydrogenase (NAD+)
MPKTISKKKNNTIKLKFDTWQYAPAPESKSAATIKAPIQIFLLMVSGWSHPAINILIRFNPATEEKLSEVAEANVADVDKAVFICKKSL